MIEYRIGCVYCGGHGCECCEKIFSPGYDCGEIVVQLDEQFMQTFTYIAETLKDIALSLLPEYLDLHLRETEDLPNIGPRPDLRYLTEVTSIDDVNVIFEGQEPQQYGDRHSFSMDTRYLYSQEFRDQKKQFAEQMDRKRELDKQSKRVKTESEIESTERALLKKLKEKYGD